jgi:hypothetical protein
MSGLDTLYSQVSNLGQKINLQSDADAARSGISAIQGAADQALASLRVKTSFPVNDVLKGANTAAQAASMKDIKGTEEATKQDSKYKGLLSFPATLASVKYFTLFTFKTYDRKVFESAKDLPSITFALPIPSNLAESFGVAYDTPAIGPIAGQLADSAISVARELIRGDTPSIESTNKMFKQFSGGQAAYIAAKQGLIGSGENGGTFGHAVDMVAGAVPNPHLAVIFSNVGLRTHSFSYKFVPTSSAELSNLKEIIKNLKIRMLPGLYNDGNMLLTFPDLCDIEIVAGNITPYKIKTCVLESLNINYSPNGPAFFKTGDPVEVSIDMTFKETSIFTREDIPEFSERGQGYR